MTAPSRAVLYSRELLGLAVELADRPFDPDAQLTAERRSRTCGSTLALSAQDAGGTLAAIGMRVQACAVGQAAAAIFAAAAEGRSLADLTAAADSIDAWLAGSAPEPVWPRIAMLAAALPHPGRHEAILLPWRAAIAALSNPARGG